MLRQALLLGPILVGCAREPAARARAEASAAPTSAAGGASVLQRTGSAKSFALLELFTSEGCSSCPPADRELEQVTEQAERTGRRVFTLSFHVDYWNDLGWSDPFSDARYSARQRHYLDHFGRSSAYTPELVVNGVEEFVGSDETTTRAATMRMLGRPAQVFVELTAARQGRTLSLRFSCGGRKGRALIQIALVQDRALSAVSAGENAGQRLSHRHVARAFAEREASLPAEGEQRFELPPDLDPAGASALVFVSDPQSREVWGVEAAKPPP